MTREQIKLLLIENGVEKPTEAMITGILNNYHAGVKSAEKEATDAAENGYKPVLQEKISTIQEVLNIEKESQPEA